MASKSYSFRVDRPVLGRSSAYARHAPSSLTRWGNNGSVSGQSGEGSNDLTHQTETILQRFENRITLANPRFIERYVKAEINILVDFRVRGIDEQYIACFQREHLTDGRNIDRLRDFQNECLSIPLQERRTAVTNVCPVLVNVEASGASAGGDQQTMFIDSIQLMEFPEGFIPSFVRLEVRDDLLRRWGHATYFSREIGLADLGRIKDGKRCQGRGFFAVRTDKIVERSPQILQNVAGKAHSVSRNVGNLGHVIDRLSGLRIALGTEFIGVGILEPDEGFFEILDVIVGPFDFGLSVADLV